MKKILSYGRSKKNYNVSFPSIRIVKAVSSDLCLLGGDIANYVKKAENEEIMASYLEVPLRRSSFDS